MNKYILFYILLCSCFFANAQLIEVVEEVPNTNFQLQYGQMYSYMESKISETTTEFTRPDKGYEISVIYERILSRFFSMQSGMQYQSHNFTLGYDRKSLYNIDMEKIIIPLIFTYNSDLCKQVNFSLFSGPQVGTLLTSSLSSLSMSNENKDTTNTVLALNKVDFGIMYGASVEISLEKFNAVKFIIGGRGSYGLSNISNNVDIESNQLNIVPNNSTIKTFGGFIGLKFVL